MIIDGTDNVDYFIYKFSLSNKNKKRLLFLNNFYSQKINNKTFSDKNLNKIFYLNGREAINGYYLFQNFQN